MNWDSELITDSDARRQIRRIIQCARISRVSAVWTDRDLSSSQRNFVYFTVIVLGTLPETTEGVNS